MSRKITAREYRRFKESFLKWQLLFGLQEYEVYFDQKDSDDDIASCSADARGCVANVTLCKTTEDEDLDIEATALHEALHLLLSRLMWMAEERYAAQGALWQENERIVRVLERLMR